MVEQVCRSPGGLSRLGVTPGWQRAGAGRLTAEHHERGILEFSDTEGKVDAFGDLRNDALGCEHLNPHIGVRLVKTEDERGKQRVRDRGRS